MSMALSRSRKLALDALALRSAGRELAKITLVASAARRLRLGPALARCARARVRLRLRFAAPTLSPARGRISGLSLSSERS